LSPCEGDTMGPKKITIPQMTPAHLRLFRTEYALSQADAARLTGVSRVTWNRYENGHNIPLYMTHVLRGVIRTIKELEP